MYSRIFFPVEGEQLAAFNRIEFWEDMPHRIHKREVFEEIPPPPSVYDSDYTLEPEVTIRKEDSKLIEEYRVNGQLYMMKVSPKNIPAYYLYKDAVGADWIRYDDPNAPMLVPQWVLFTF